MDLLVKKSFSDIFGRVVKTQTFNWDGTTVYQTSATTFNVWDQPTLIRQYAGDVSSSTYQDTTLSYDGYGRKRVVMRSFSWVGICRILILGMVNGFSYAWILFFAVRQHDQYIIQRNKERADALGTTPAQFINFLNVRSITILLIISFAVASVIAFRFWRREWKSSILFWEAVGLSAVIGYQVFNLSMFWLDGMFAGGRGYAVKDSPVMSWPVMFGLVLIVNLIFAVLVRIGTAAVSSRKTA